MKDDSTPQNGAQAQTGSGQDDSVIRDAEGQAMAKRDGQFTIPTVVLEKYPELVELIKKTESMSDEEREYWFQILPIMTEDQVTRLRKILTEEAQQLAKLDKEYQSELSKLNKKHLTEWDAVGKKEEREARQAQEAASEQSEASAEEAILDELDEV